MVNDHLVRWPPPGAYSTIECLCLRASDIYCIWTSLPALNGILFAIDATLFQPAFNPQVLKSFTNRTRKSESVELFWALLDPPLLDHFVPALLGIPVRPISGVSFLHTAPADLLSHLVASRSAYQKRFVLRSPVG